MAALDDAAAAGRPAGATIDLALVAPAYHEKQSLMRCAVHSLNNLVRSPHPTHLPVDREATSSALRLSITDLLSCCVSVPASVVRRVLTGWSLPAAVTRRMAQPAPLCAGLGVRQQRISHIYQHPSPLTRLPSPLCLLCSQQLRHQRAHRQPPPLHARTAPCTRPLNLALTPLFSLCCGSAQLALEAAGYNLHWHDRRQPLKRVSSPPLLGFIVNQTTPRLFSLYRSQHWYPCRAFDDGRAWFELNSVKPRAVAIPDVVAYCEALLLDPHTQLLWIVQRGVKREEVYAERGVGTFTPPPASNDAAG